jgi:hypothetical protein
MTRALKGFSVGDHPRRFSSIFMAVSFAQNYVAVKNLDAVLIRNNKGDPLLRVDYNAQTRVTTTKYANGKP